MISAPIRFAPIEGWGDGENPHRFNAPDRGFCLARTGFVQTGSSPGQDFARKRYARENRIRFQNVVQGFQPGRPRRGLSQRPTGCCTRDPHTRTAGRFMPRRTSQAFEGDLQPQPLIPLIAPMRDRTRISTVGGARSDRICNSASSVKRNRTLRPHVARQSSP